MLIIPRQHHGSVIGSATTSVFNCGPEPGRVASHRGVLLTSRRPPSRVGSAKRA